MAARVRASATGRRARVPPEERTRVGARRGARPGPGAAVPELDPLIHQRVRLGIMSALAVNDSLTFADLKGLLEVTDGNLSVHARKLEEAGYITCTKSFQGRIPKTEYRLSETGHQALERYLDRMEELIHVTRGD
jgi:DNA-binding transcriptional ArsR family regulator